MILCRIWNSGHCHMPWAPNIRTAFFWMHSRHFLQAWWQLGNRNHHYNLQSTFSNPFLKCMLVYMCAKIFETYLEFIQSFALGGDFSGIQHCPWIPCFYILGTICMVQQYIFCTDSISIFHHCKVFPHAPSTLVIAGRSWIFFKLLSTKPNDQHLLNSAWK